MSTYGAVRASFNSLLGVSGDDIQNAYGMQGDWCAMTVFIGFRNAGALDNLADGMKTAWVPSLWDWYNCRGLTGSAPQAGALVFYDFNSNGTPDHIEYVNTVSGSNSFSTIAGNTGACRAVQTVERDTEYVLGFAYPEYSTEEDKIAATPQEEEEEIMQFIYQPNGANCLYYYDGVFNHPLRNNDEVEAIKQAYEKATGKGIKMFELGSKDAPWATRFWTATERFTDAATAQFKDGSQTAQ